MYVCVSLAQIFRSGLICLPGTLQKQTAEVMGSNPGKGNCFFLSLTANKAAEQAQKKAGTANSRSSRILIDLGLGGVGGFPPLPTQIKYLKRA
jgi:hypothetical protein